MKKTGYSNKLNTFAETICTLSRTMGLPPLRIALALGTASGGAGMAKADEDEDEGRLV